MDRPRIAAIVSGAAASAAAFVVVSRSSLLGTPAGAAIVPIIYTLVSYASSTGLDRAGEWLQFRMPVWDRRKREPPGAGGERAPLAHESSEAPPSGPERGAGEEQRGAVTYYRTAGRRRMNPQWLLAGSAFVALATSVYVVASPPAAETVEKVVVQRQVIEKTVTVTTEAEPSDPAGAEAGTKTPERPGTSTSVSTPAGPDSTDAPAPGGEETDVSSPGTTPGDGSGTDTTLGPEPPTTDEAAEPVTPSPEEETGGPETGPVVEEAGSPPVTPAP